MRYALAWRCTPATSLVEENNIEFKQALDDYKYAACGEDRARFCAQDEAFFKETNLFIASLPIPATH